jgi:hypothetical protein
MVNISWEGMCSALKAFETPANVSEGDIAIIHRHKFVYQNGEWIEKEPINDD